MLLEYKMRLPELQLEALKEKTFVGTTPTKAGFGSLYPAGAQVELNCLQLMQTSWAADYVLKSAKIGYDDTDLAGFDDELDDEDELEEDAAAAGDSLDEYVFLTYTVIFQPFINHP